MIEKFLTYSAGVAVSPVPVILVIHILSAGRRRGSVLFAAGSLSGLLVVVLCGFALTSLGIIRGHVTRGPSLVTGALNVALGLWLLALALREYRRRQMPRQQPGWARRLRAMGPAGALLAGAVVTALLPKNLGIALNAGSDAGRANGPGAETAVLIAAFIVLGTSTVTAPVVMALAAPRRSAAVLASWREFLTQHEVAISLTVCAVFGLIFVGKGIDFLRLA